MKILLLAVLFAAGAFPQGRALDWPSYGGDARRSGWERSDVRITRDNITKFQLIWKQKLQNPGGGPMSLTAPIVIGQLISYRGFKELGFVANSAGDLWSLDVDLNRVFWKKQFSPPTPAGCPGFAAMPALTPPLVFGGARRTPAPATPPRKVSARVDAGSFGAPRSVFLVSNDGKLHQVNSSDGSDQFPPVDFLPAGAKASSLTVHDNVVYTTTSGKCGGETNAVWAIDLADEAPRAVRYALTEGEATGLGGFAIGNDGLVYVNTGNKTLVLSPRELKLVQSLQLGEGPVKNAPTPVVFDHNGQDLVVSAGPDGRLQLHDSQKKIAESEPIVSGTSQLWGGISAWKDDAGIDWVAVPVWGEIDSRLRSSIRYGANPNGGVVAFRVETKAGQLALVPAWISRDLRSPVPPVITSGLVFALSTSGRATLFGLDAATGKELYSSGEQASGPASLTGLSLSNGRVYFTAVDGTLYAFGIFLEI